MLLKIRTRRIATEPSFATVFNGLLTRSRGGRIGCIPKCQAVRSNFLTYRNLKDLSLLLLIGESEDFDNVSLCHHKHF